MTDDPARRDSEPGDFVDKGGGSGVVFALVTVALILAIIFFYLTRDAREDRRSDAVTKAAGALDEAARRVGDAASETADRLREKGDNNQIGLTQVRTE